MTRGVHPPDGPVDGAAAGPAGGPVERVETYVDQLAAALPLQLPDSAALLEEIRDHLFCDVEQAWTSGVPVQAALDVAVARVGDPATVGADWRAEVVRGAVRAADTALLRLVVLAGAAWLLVLATGPAAHWRGIEPRSVPRLEELGSAGAGLSVAAATTGVLLVGLAGARARAGVRAAATRWLDRWALTATVLALLAALASAAGVADLLRILAVAAPGSVTGVGVLVGTSVSVLAVVLSVPGLDRLCRVVCRRPAGIGADGRRDRSRRPAA